MDFDSIKKEANASFLFYTTSIITHYIWAQVGITCPVKLRLFKSNDKRGSYV
jgi:hypothetical protein